MSQCYILPKNKTKSMKFKLLLLSLLISSVSLSQQWQGSSGSAGVIYRDGEISSIKGTGPSRITLGSLWASSPLDWSWGYLSFNTARTGTVSTPWLYDGDGASNGSAVIFSNVAGNIFFSNRASSGGTGGTLTDEQIMNGIKMRIEKDGKVVIGTAPAWGFNGFTWPGNYKLFVQDGILTERVKVAVKNTADWSDYVFQPNYKLMPINDLKLFIYKNKHLPEIPSAEQMVKEGNDLGSTDAKLLAKIEELTLYIIEMNEKIEKQQEDILRLKRELSKK
jgi:hypothetical protein